jgi:hypothetical protein
VGGLVAGGFGAGEVDQIEHTVLGGWDGRVLEAEAADGVGARRAVVLQRWGSAAEGGGGFDISEENVLGGDLVFQGTSHLGCPKRVLEDGDLIAKVEQVCDAVSTGHQTVPVFVSP